MNRCNAIAMAIYGEMFDHRETIRKTDKDEVTSFTLQAATIQRVLQTNGAPAIADWRIDEIGRDLAKALAEYGFEACGVSWFAHMLEHDIYDPNLKRSKP